MTLYTPSIIIDSVFEALGAFIQPFVGSAQIVRAQVNRVAMPLSPFVMLTEILSVDLGTPISTNDSVDQTFSILGPKRIDIQIDFYGASAGDFCAAVKSVWRTPYTTSQFPDNIQPLYLSDGRQMPLITGEEQYLDRWTITATLNYLPAVTVPIQSATTLSMNIVDDIQ